MSPDAQQIAIAKACGKVIPSYTVSEEYVDDPHWNSGFWQTTALFNDGKRMRLSGRASETKVGTWERLYATDTFPDYLHSLDAMHEAEKMLEGDDYKIRDYEDRLCEILNDANRNKPRWLGPTRFAYTRATAAQRAEAFLRTLNLWEDNQ